MNALHEIKDLKTEIARLTESLSGFASFTQSVHSNNNFATNMADPRHQMYSVESKVALTEVKGANRLDSRESTCEVFEKMDLDELHSV